MELVNGIGELPKGEGGRDLAEVPGAPLRISDSGDVGIAGLRAGPLPWIGEESRSAAGFTVAELPWAGRVSGTLPV